MSIIGSALRASAVSDLTNPAGWLTTALGGTRRTKAGQDVGPKSAMTLPVYYACIRNIAEDVGKLPFVLFEQDGKKREPAMEHPVYPLIHDEPNPEMGSQAFRELLTHWAIGDGTGYAEVVRGANGVPAELWPIHPSRVRRVRLTDGSLWYNVRGSYASNDGSRVEADVQIPAADMLVIHGLGSDGMTGYSAIEIAAEAIGLGLAAQSYGATFFGGSTAINSVLTTTNKITNETKEKMRADWQERYTGPDAHHRPVILDGTWDFKRIDIPPDQAQFIETRRLTVEEVARVLRMPLSKIGAGDGGAGGEEEAIAYVRDTLMPWFVRWERAVARWMLAPSERAAYYAKIVDQAMLRGNHAARSAYYQMMQNNGNLTINEVRELEEKNPIEGGDQHFVALNRIPLEDAPAYAKAIIQKSATGAEPLQKNPTDEGGGSNNEPRPTKENAKKIGAVFLNATCRRLAHKAAKASEAANTKGGSAFAAWSTDFYAGLTREAIESLSEQAAACGSLLGTDVPATRWTEAVRTQVEAWGRACAHAHGSGTMTAWIASMNGSGPELALAVVEAIGGGE